MGLISNSSFHYTKLPISISGDNYRNVLGGADVAILLVNQMWPSCGVALTNALRFGFFILTRVI